MLLALDKVLGRDFQRNTTTEGSRTFRDLQSLLKVADKSARNLVTFNYNVFKHFKMQIVSL